MPAFAEESLVDIHAAIEIVPKIIELILAARGRNPSSAWLNSEMGKVLRLLCCYLTFIVTYQQPSPLDPVIVTRIVEESVQCHLTVAELYRKMNTSQGLFQRLWWGTPESEAKELAAFSIQLDQHRTTLNTALQYLVDADRQNRELEEFDGQLQQELRIGIRKLRRGGEKPSPSGHSQRTAVGEDSTTNNSSSQSDVEGKPEQHSVGEDSTTNISSSQSDVEGKPEQDANILNRDICVILERLDELFHDNEAAYTKFLESRDTTAQQVLDMLQILLDYTNVPRSTRRWLFKTLIRLSANSKLHPRCLSFREGLEDQKLVTGGSFSDVYKGLLGRQSIAVKMMRVFADSDIDVLRKEFGREALIWRQLSHPNLLPFFGLYYFQKRLCLVSPWMENGNIRMFLKKEHCSTSRRLFFILDVALGLEYLHDKYVVHGDLKPDNIFVTPSLRACIADFGLSSIITTISSAQLTSSSKRQRGGTLRYQAPELHLGGHNNTCSDIYAFACVAYELLTGNTPFPELRADGAVIDAVLKGRRPTLPTTYSSTPEADCLWDLLQNCWKELPEMRPTASQIVEQLTGPGIHLMTDQSATDWDETFTSKFRRSTLSRPRLPSVLEIDDMILGSHDFPFRLD